MSERQVRRVVLAGGEVRDVEVGSNGVQWCAFVGGYHGWGREQSSAVAAVVGLHGWPVAEILAPGEPTRAEAVAAAIAEHQRHTDAAVDGVRAMLPAAMAQARREGAEAMREVAVDACRGALQSAGDIVPVGRVADAIRALPLPGDVTPGDEVTP